jgi:integrase
MGVFLKNGRHWRCRRPARRRRNAGLQLPLRCGRIDLAWHLLMLHCGLRTGEVQFLRLSALDLGGRQLRTERSKGLKDMVVLLAAVTVEALSTYLEVRGVAATDHVFIYRHRPQSSTYCRKRLGTYGRRCGIHVRPHQLRHTCATLFLNAGAPILTIRRLLGHRNIDTTLIYTRLYDRPSPQTIIVRWPRSRDAPGWTRCTWARSTTRSARSCKRCTWRSWRST